MQNFSDYLNLIFLYEICLSHIGKPENYGVAGVLGVAVFLKLMREVQLQSLSKLLKRDYKYKNKYRQKNVFDGIVYVKCNKIKKQTNNYTNYTRKDNKIKNVREYDSFQSYTCIFCYN